MPVDCATPKATMTRVRWWMLALLFFATTINYLDRIVFSVLVPVIRQEMRIDPQHYGYLTSAFTFAYMFGFLGMGKLVDRFGTKIGYTVSIVWWSLAAGAHVLATSVFSLAFWRAMLGFGESGNFPSAIKSVTEWFPKKDRAFATGIFNAGSNVASMVGPPVFVWMVVHYGWRGCFLVTSALGFIWVVLWLIMYKLPGVHPGVNKAELDYIHSDTAGEENEPQVSWSRALTKKQTWAFGIAKFLTDPVWWFYLYWLPPYFYDARKFKLEEIGWALPVIYLMADFGSVAGGWLSGFFLRRGWDNSKSRKTAMAVCAACMPIGALSVLAASPVLAVALVALACSAHQGWSANLYTTTSDVFPKNAVGSVTGIGGFFGGFGGFLFSGMVAGYVVEHFGYVPIFLFMGTLHLIALVVVHTMMGKMRKLEVV